MGGGPRGEGGGAGLRGPNPFARSAWEEAERSGGKVQGGGMGCRSGWLGMTVYQNEAEPVCAVRIGRAVGDPTRSPGPGPGQSKNVESNGCPLDSAVTRNFVGLSNPKARWIQHPLDSFRVRSESFKSAQVRVCYRTTYAGRHLYGSRTTKSRRSRVVGVDVEDGRPPDAKDSRG